MAVEMQTLIDTIARLMTEIERDFDDCDAETGDMMLIVEVLDADGRRELRIAPNEGARRHVRRGLLDEAERIESASAAQAVQRGKRDGSPAGSG